MKAGSPNHFNCNYYDQLEAWSLRKETVNILYSDGNDHHEERATIEKLFIQNGEEFLTTSNGTEIPLLKLIAINGWHFNAIC